MNGQDSETRASIINAVRERNPDRWTEFYTIYKPMLMGYFRRQGLCDGSAQDLTHDVFLKLFEKIRGYDRSRTRFRTWLFTVARNTLIDQARRRDSQRNALDGWAKRVLAMAADEEDRQRREFERHHHERVLQFAFAKVRQEASPRVWNCFEMSVIRGMSGADVAAELGVTANVVYVNSWRVLQNVKEVCRCYDEDLKHESDDLVC